MYIQIKKLRLYPAAIIFTSMFGTLFSPVYASEKPHRQDFVVTAYYSPVPDQCCYFRGSYEEEVAFNGEGRTGADGTPVYPGMFAAPDTYAFGTVIQFPGLGVGTVHDRGSRITEWGADVHRIDIWMGYGEEGLARALAWGARRMTGVVYPAGTEEVPRENFAFTEFPSDSSVLASLPKSDPVSVLAQAKFQDQNYAARLLQETLAENGYFSGPKTGQFGTKTRDALKDFISEYGLKGDGASVSETAAAALITAGKIKPKNLPEVTSGLGEGARGNQVRQVQKLLRYFGFYRGRTDGVYNRKLKDAVLAFQLKSGVIKHSLDQGAGYIGPATKTAIQKSWKVRQVAVKTQATLTKSKIAKTEKQKIPGKTLVKGDTGEAVRTLQQFLRKMGYLSKDDITGKFGSKTEKALITYQKSKKIITSRTQHGAGVFGPATKKTMIQDLIVLQMEKAKYEGLKNG